MLRHDRPDFPAPRTDVPNPGRRLDERGSALLVTLMISTILTLLGLGFLALSTQEGQITQNERNAKQALYMAQVGAKVAMEWFQTPTPNDPPSLANNDDFLPTRGEIIFNKVQNITYKGGSTGLNGVGNDLFDRPYRGVPKDTFRGTEEKTAADPGPDVHIASNSPYLARLNSALLGGSQMTDTRLTDIRIYAPPMVNGSRYGLATIRSTATKFDSAGEILASRTVYLTLNEIKFPRPTGPVDARGTIASNGNTYVHWGEVRNYSRLEGGGNGTNRMPNGMPWDGPAETAKFGTMGDLANAQLADRKWHALQGFSSQAGTARSPDLWFRIRSAAEITDWLSNGTWMPCTDTLAYTPDRTGVSPHDVVNEPKDTWQYKCNTPDEVQIFPFDHLGTTVALLRQAADRWDNNGAAGQWEPTNVFRWDPNFELTEMSYDTWKKVAQGRGRNVHYMRTTNDGATYQQNGVGVAKSMGDWADIYTAGTEVDGRKAGIWFFDTKTNTNPQPCDLADTDCGARLATSNQADFGDGVIPGGFLYANSENIGPGSSEVVDVPMPGETAGFAWKDVNPHVKIGGVDYLWVYQPGSDPCTLADTDNSANCTHLIQNGTNMPNGNALNVPSDILLQMDDSWADSGTWQYYDVSDGIVRGSKDANLFDPMQDVAKPFVNFDYSEVQAEACCTGPHPKHPVKIGHTTVATTFTAMGMTAGVDRDGPMVPLDTALYGILYNEGNWDDAGNTMAFGAILVGKDFTASGTVDVFFDERIIKDAWPPKEWRIPRVRPASWKTE